MKVAVLTFATVLTLFFAVTGRAGDDLSPQAMTFTEAWAACLRQGLTLPEVGQLQALERQIGSQLDKIPGQQDGFLWTLSKNANPEFPRTGYTLAQRTPRMAKLSDRGFALCVSPEKGKESTDSYYARLMAAQLGNEVKREPAADVKSVEKRFEHSFLILSDEARKAAVTAIQTN